MEYAEGGDLFHLKGQMSGELLRNLLVVNLSSV